MNGSTKFCRYCGEKIPIDSEFCEKCGRVLTPEKETATPPPAVANQTPRSGRRLFLGVLIIAIVLVAMITISYVPNPWNHLWVSVDYAYMETHGIEGLTLQVSIHNPTHHTYQIGLNDVSLTWVMGPVGGLHPLTSGLWTTTGPGNFYNLELAASGPTQLRPCTPALLRIYFHSDHFSQYSKGTFHLNLTLTINGATVTFTDDFTETFALITHIPQMPDKAPNECVPPWVDRRSMLASEALSWFDYEGWIVSWAVKDTGMLRVATNGDQTPSTRS